MLAVPVPDAFRVRLARHYDVLGPYDMRLGDAVDALPREDRERVAVLLGFGNARVSAELMDRLAALGLVCCLGSGYEGVDVAAAGERGIAVSHNVGPNAAAVADLAIGLMIASIRGIVSGDAFVRRGAWTRGQRPDDRRGLTGRRVGVFGLGAIGAKIASRCEALEMDVGYHGRAPHAGVRYPYHATLVDLARWADVLMIAVRAGPHNRHAVDAAVLAALGADGHVVNVTRGSIIDEAALARALADRTIAGAGLDVFEREPEVPESLKRLDNVVLTPHLGGAAHEAQDAMREAALANVEAYAARGAALTPVPESR
jgi:glyoxylate reductase